MSMSNHIDPDGLMSVGGAAKALGVSIKTMHRWDGAGILTAIRLPSGHRRYRRADINAFTDNGLKARIETKRSTILDAMLLLDLLDSTGELTVAAAEARRADAEFRRDEAQRELSRLKADPIVSARAAHQ